MDKKIFVGSIPTSYRKEEIIEYFSAYGKIMGFSIIVKKSNKDHICGILSCAEGETTQRILSEKHILRGQILDCHIYLRGNKLKKYLDELNLRNVYVTEIPINCTFNQLKCIFGKFGKIQNIKFLHSKKIKEKYAIVTFFDIEAAQEALKRKRVRGFGSMIKIKVFKDRKTKMKEKNTQRKGKGTMGNQFQGASSYGSSSNKVSAQQTGASPKHSGSKERAALKSFSFNQGDKVHELFRAIRWGNPSRRNHSLWNLRVNRPGLL